MFKDGKHLDHWKYYVIAIVLLRFPISLYRAVY